MRSQINTRHYLRKSEAKIQTGGKMLAALPDQFKPFQ